MFTGVYHVGYLTDNLARGVEFFEALFGSKTLIVANGDDGTRAAYIQVGDVQLEVIEPGDKSKLGGKTGLVVDHLGYDVADLDSTVAALKGQGIKFTTEQPTTNPLGSRMIFVEGASALGTRMHLNQAKAK
jgi:catechol 2,3-dioxygenase-like lactoylglutathione lyase family enzyme